MGRCDMNREFKWCLIFCCFTTIAIVGIILCKKNCDERSLYFNEYSFQAKIYGKETSAKACRGLPGMPWRDSMCLIYRIDF